MKMKTLAKLKNKLVPYLYQTDLPTDSRQVALLTRNLDWLVSVIRNTIKAHIGGNGVSPKDDSINIYHNARKMLRKKRPARDRGRASQ